MHCKIQLKQQFKYVSFKKFLIPQSSYPNLLKLQMINCNKATIIFAERSSLDVVSMIFTLGLNSHARYIFMGYNYPNIFLVILRYFNCFMSAAAK